MIPKISSYGRYSSSNYDVNTLTFTVKGIDLYFSYKTLVAFRGPEGLVVHENDWGPITGKHLNWIDDGDKKSRVSDKEFNRLFSELAIS